MRNRVSITTILICCLFTAMAFADANGQDGSSAGCTVANIAGTYGYVGFGVVRPGNPFGFPDGTYSSVGTLAFDGKGNLVIVDTERIDDVFFPPDTSYTATYTMDKQCLGSFTITALAEAGIPGPHFKFVSVDRRKKILAMSLLPGVSVAYVNTTRAGETD